MNLNLYILQLKLKVAELILQLLRLQTGKVVNPDRRLALYETARMNLEKDLVPDENDLACAAHLNQVFKKAFGREIGGNYSTYRMYQVLRTDYRFQRVLTPLAGDIIISPTGYAGSGGVIPNGHVGLCSDNGKIMSNDSQSGLWTENYDMDSWRLRYVKFGKFPMLFYRVISG